MRKGLVLALALGASACGPIAYVNAVTRKASDSVEEARAAQADKYAPYYWTRATQYLHQAKVLAAHADFQAANRFGRLANEAAEKAIVEAQVAAKDPSKRPLELDKQIAPAKGGDEKEQEIAPAKDDKDVTPPEDKKAPKKKPAPAKDKKDLAPAKDSP